MTGIITTNPSQPQADVAVVLPTILRPDLMRAVRSVYTQNFAGRIHVLIGVDVALGDRAILDAIRAQCPDRVSLTILDPGYSTSARHGGVHSNAFGGSLRTVLSYMANAPLIAYLDDNDWWGANHLTALKAAIAGKHWAWSGRWLVHPQTGWPICRDEWDSVGPNQGINAERYGGFVQPSGLMMDMRTCHHVMPLWAMALFADGSGEDRLIFDQLHKNHPGAGTGQYTSYCTLTQDTLPHAHHQREFLARRLGWIYDAQTMSGIIAQMGQVLDLLEARQWDPAQEQAEQILQVNPVLAQAWAVVAQCHQMNQRWDQAIDGWIKALEIDDQHPHWIECLAICLQHSGHGVEAERIQATLIRRFGPTT